MVRPNVKLGLFPEAVLPILLVVTELSCSLGLVPMVEGF